LLQFSNHYAKVTRLRNTGRDFAMNSPFYHQDVPVIVRVAQVVGITSAAALAGGNLGLSFITIPALMEAPAPLLAKQWQKAYSIGKAVAPPLSVITSVVFGYLAYREKSTSTQAFSLYTAAALLGPGIIPYTLLVMAPTNQKLHDKADSLTSSTAGEVGVAKEDTVHALADRWASFNFVRALISATSAALGAWAALQSTEVVGIASLGMKTGADRLG